jgi:hypothetical protein
MDDQGFYWWLKEAYRFRQILETHSGAKGSFSLVNSMDTRLTAAQNIFRWAVAELERQVRWETTVT